MYAAVLRAIGSAPRCEEFSEPVVSDNDGEAIVHVHGASLKPVEKQLGGGSHYASRREGRRAILDLRFVFSAIPAVKISQR